MCPNTSPSNRISIRQLLLAATVSVATLMGGAATSHAAACLDDVTHWGKISQSKWQAKKAARAGMRWKVENLLDHSVVVHRGPRIQQCKYRSNDWNEGWQCQAAIVVNVCQ